MKRIVTSLGVVSLVWCAEARSAEPPDERIEWVRENAIEITTPQAGNGLEELGALKAIIGDARIVSLGEGTHGTREFFQMKHRLVELLAAEMGFTIFSIEASMPESYRLKDYVLTGVGDPKALIAGMYFWTWNTEEVFDMVEWMKAFNSSGAGRIVFTGFDMQTPDVAMQIARAFIASHDPDFLPDVDESIGLVERATASRRGGSGVVTGNLPVEAVAGKQVRYRGALRTEGVAGSRAGLWLRADGPDGVLEFDDMDDRGPSGDTPWKDYEIVVDVPDEAVNVNFGAIHSGDGTVWVDALSIEIDGEPYDRAGGVDLDFEGDEILGFNTDGNAYEIVLDDDLARTGEQSLRIRRTMKRSGNPHGGPFGVATGNFPVEAAAGKRIRFSGFIRTEGVDRGFAGLWWRVDGPAGVLAFDNMSDRGPTNDAPWREYEIVLDVPEEVTNINFGVIHPGDGVAWFDGLQVEIDGAPFDPEGAFDLDFEARLPVGFFTSGRGYEIIVANDDAKTGGRSLRSEFFGVLQDEGPKVVAERWTAILSHMEKSREAYLEHADAEEIDWVTQNARVVVQCMGSIAGQTGRDECMATNVKWILDQEPDAKIVLWAHNGHVQRVIGAMGAYLDDWYGDDQIVIGFAGGEGDYTAIGGDGLSQHPMKPPQPGSVEDHFRRTGMPMFFLDVRKADPEDPASAWLTKPIPMRSIGALAMEQQFFPTTPSEVFDAIIYFDETTPSVTLRR